MSGVGDGPTISDRAARRSGDRGPERNPRPIWGGLDGGARHPSRLGVTLERAGVEVDELGPEPAGDVDTWREERRGAVALLVPVERMP